MGHGNFIITTVIRTIVAAIALRILACAIDDRFWRVCVLVICHVTYRGLIVSL